MPLCCPCRPRPRRACTVTASAACGGNAKSSIASVARPRGPRSRWCCRKSTVNLSSFDSRPHVCACGCTSLYQNSRHETRSFAPTRRCHSERSTGWRSTAHGSAPPGSAHAPKPPALLGAPGAPPEATDTDSLIVFSTSPLPADRLDIGSPRGEPPPPPAAHTSASAVRIASSDCPDTGALRPGARQRAAAVGSRSTASMPPNWGFGGVQALQGWC
jgi:hypothetical protein